MVPWAGSMAYTDNLEEGVWVLISQQKWENVKRLLISLRAMLEESMWVDHNVLEKVRGFLIYVYRT
jgi:hypothetical protein